MVPDFEESFAGEYVAARSQFGYPLIQVRQVFRGTAAEVFSISSFDGLADV